MGKWVGGGHQQLVSLETVSPDMMASVTTERCPLDYSVCPISWLCVEAIPFQVDEEAWATLCSVTQTQNMNKLFVLNQKKTILCSLLILCSVIIIHSHVHIQTLQFLFIFFPSKAYYSFRLCLRDCCPWEVVIVM